MNDYEAVTPDEKTANPAYAEQVAPLVVNLRAEPDRLKRLAPRAAIRKALVGIDPERFRARADGHFEAHFGIVGFTMPTPVSDGKHVFVRDGTGVAACFDLDGRRRSVTRIPADHLSYGSSPVVAGGLVVFQNALCGLDAGTGRQLWQQNRVRNNVGSLLGATVAGKPVVVTQRGDLGRPSDGEILDRPPGSDAAGDTGWSPPVIVGDRLYQPKDGVTSLTVRDLKGVAPADWEPPAVRKIALPPEVSRGAGGKWIDRWSAGSPLVWNGRTYQTDIYHGLYVVDVATGKMVYRKETEREGFTHDNAVAVAASPALVGRHVLVCDNQGTTLVFEPGPVRRVVARNRIATVVDRAWPVPGQETPTHAPPVADGGRPYLRGEAYLYRVGER